MAGNDGSACAPDSIAIRRIGYPIARDARRSATTATILVSAGLAAAGVGVYLYLTTPDAREIERESSLQIVPVLGPGSAGIGLTGGF